MKKSFLIIFLLFITFFGVHAQMLEQWSSNYNGTEGYDDIVSDMEVDALGNVYVTGYSFDSITGQTNKIDYATVKYNSSGVQEWASTYNGPADMQDFAHSIGVDANGNVYVTGGSMGTDTTEEWATIKYNSFGVQLWVQRWQGLPGSGHNRAIDMVVDALGNSYVTGYGETTMLEDIDYVTIKYNTDGIQEWISTYSKIPNYPSGSDVATSIAIDNIGNIYVTGSSYDTVTRGQWDIATIKYNPAGEEQWVSRHPGATVTYLEGPEIITDNFGNACVAGGYGGYNIRYNSDGDQQTLENPYGFRSTDIAVDLSGNFYITGNTYGSPYKTTTIKYNTEGDSVWSRSFNNINSNPQLAFDNCLGYIYVTATAYDNINLSDFLTVRYNSIGDSLFSIRYNAQEITSDVSVAIAVDDMANVYVAGYSGADQWSQQDIATVKYTPSSFFIHSISNEDTETEINDNESSSDSTLIDCSLTNYLIANVEVTIEDLEHPNDSDLEIYLINSSSNREEIIDTLVYQAGGSGDNFTGTKFSDAASISINDGVAPFTGYFKPHSPLSKFNGLSMEGTWILKIYDRASGNEGVLKSWSVDFTLSAQPAGIQDNAGEIPERDLLSQNYPNPFNQHTKIKFEIPQNAGNSPQEISLKVFDIRGAEVDDLFTGKRMPGSYEVDFDGTNLPGGIYYCKLASGDFTSTRKMILLK